MKAFLVTLSLVLPLVCAADSSIYRIFTLSWDAPVFRQDGQPLTDLEGFLIYYGCIERDIHRTILVRSASANSQELDGLVPGEWYVEIVAINAKYVSLPARLTFEVK